MVAIIAGIIMILFGSYLVTNPKAVVRKDYRRRPTEIRKAKRSGIVVVICGVIAIALGIFVLMV